MKENAYPIIEIFQKYYWRCYTFKYVTFIFELYFKKIVKVAQKGYIPKLKSKSENVQEEEETRVGEETKFIDQPFIGAEFNIIGTDMHGVALSGKGHTQYIGSTNEMYT